MNGIFIHDTDNCNQLMVRQQQTPRGFLLFQIGANQMPGKKPESAITLIIASELVRLLVDSVLLPIIDYA